jgi:hypothetical protein
MWVLMRTDQGGGYLAGPGQPDSYTKQLEGARTFYSKEAAEAEACPDNEVAVRVEDRLLRPR